MSTTLLQNPSSGNPGLTSQQPYTQYSYNYTAITDRTFVTFEFRQDPAYWGLDDASITAALDGTQKLTNGGFETGDLSSWTLIGQQGLSAAGRVKAGSPGTSTSNSHTGSYFFRDGAIGGVDGIYQSFASTPGQQYTISFWLANDGNSTDSALAVVQVGGNPYATTPTSLALDPGSDTGTQGDGITSVNQPVITGNGTAQDTITLLDGNTVIGTGIVGSDGRFSITPSAPLGNGAHSLTAVDSSGDATPPSAAVTITVVPPAPSLQLAAGSDTGAQGDDITAVNMPVISGHGTAGDNIALFDGATQVGFSAVAADGSWSVTLGAPLSDGTHNLTATDTDANGNTSATTALALSIDTSAPSAPSATSLAAASDSGALGDGITNVTAPTLAGTAETGSVVSVYDGNILLGTTVATNGAWSFVSGSLANGSHQITATATDTAGNTSTQSSSFTLVVDAVIPTVTAALANDTGSSPLDTVTSDPALTGSGDPSAIVTVTEGNVTLGTTNADVNGVWTFTPTGLTDGAHTLTALETDAAGNTGSTQVNLILDTSAPTSALMIGLLPASDSGILGDGLTNIGAPTLTGSAEAGTTVTIYDGNTQLGTAIVAQNGTWTFGTTSLADGVHQVTATVTDAAGNVSIPSASFALTIDTVAPLMTAALLDDTGLSRSDGLTSNPTLAGSGDPNATVTITEGAAILGAATADSQGNWIFTPTGLGNGAHTLGASETDAAGNRSVVQVSMTLDVDAPAAAALLKLASASDTGAPGDGITNVAAPSVTGTAEPGSVITLYDGTIVIGTATAALDGTWSVASGVLADGQHQITALATDPAGNVSPLSGTMALTVDTVPPALKAGLLNDTGSSATDRLTSDATLTGSGDPNAVVTIFDGNSALGTTMADASGNWTFAPKNLQLGAHALIASESDTAGNKSTAQINIRLDPSSAAVPSDVIPVNAVTSGLARFFDTVTGTQFYTSSLSEYNSILANRPDLTREVNDLNALNPATVADDPNASPVFRFFDAVHGTHFFTTDTGERDSVIASRPDLHFEGVGFFEHAVQQTGDTAVYRFFDTNNGTHFYTASESERASIVSTRPDLTAEGIGFYAPKMS